MWMLELQDDFVIIYKKTRCSAAGYYLMLLSCRRLLLWGKNTLIFFVFIALAVPRHFEPRGCT